MMGHLFSKALPRGATLRSRKVAKERARLEFLERNMSAHARQIATAPARDQPPDLPSSKIKLDFQYTLSDTKRYIIEKDPLSDRTETHITRFNERSLLKWAWLRTVKGTVFSYPSAPFIWIQLCILLVVAFATAIVTHNISFKHLDESSNIPWFQAPGPADWTRRGGWRGEGWWWAGWVLGGNSWDLTSAPSASPSGFARTRSDCINFPPPPPTPAP